MIDPAELVNNLVDLLREIPELVAWARDEPANIYAYHDAYPKKSSLALAIHQMPRGGVLVVWEGTALGSLGSMSVWKHQIGIYLRSTELNDDDPPTSYYRAFRLLWKGVPASQTQPMSNVTVHASFDPMDVPSIQRDTDAEGLDYFKVTASFTERGDE